jgi:hypothetical protein
MEGISWLAGVHLVMWICHFRLVQPWDITRQWLQRLHDADEEMCIKTLIVKRMVFWPWGYSIQELPAKKSTATCDSKENENIKIKFNKIKMCRFPSE